jgi:hypothetical protein
MDAIPQKPYKRLSYSAWRIRKRDPLIYTGPLRKGLLAVSGLGELEYKSSNEVTTPFSLKKIAAILPL